MGRPRGPTLLLAAGIAASACAVVAFILAVEPPNAGLQRVSDELAVAALWIDGLGVLAMAAASILASRRKRRGPFAAVAATLMLAFAAPAMLLIGGFLVWYDDSLARAVWLAAACALVAWPASLGWGQARQLWKLRRKTRAALPP